MPKYTDLTPIEISILIKDRKLVDLLAKRNFPRQIMVIAGDKSTLANYEYPVFLTKQFLFDGPENYTKDMADVVREIIDSGQSIAEVYVLSSRGEYERVVNYIKELQQEISGYDNISCHHVNFDLEMIRAEFDKTRDGLFIDITAPEDDYNNFSFDEGNNKN